MPEIVDDVKDEAEDNWKGALAYGVATGVGGAFGPLGHIAGSVAAGTYEGGTTGASMTQIGGGEGIRQIIQSGMGGGNSGGNSNVKEL